VDEPKVDSKREALFRELAGLRDLPPAPRTLDDVWKVLGQETSSLSALADVLQRDAALTAKVLRLANSAYYGLPRPVSEVRTACIVLGFETIRSLAVGVSVLEALSRSVDEVLDLSAFWRHSVGTATAAQALARRSQLDVGTAFCAGVLHDLGKLVLATLAPARWKRVAEGAPGAEIAEFGASHAEGRGVARRALLARAAGRNPCASRARIRRGELGSARAAGRRHRSPRRLRVAWSRNTRGGGPCAPRARADRRRGVCSGGERVRTRARARRGVRRSREGRVVISEHLERILAWLEGDGPHEPVRAATAREVRDTLELARDARTRERMLREILHARNEEFEEKIQELSIVKEVGERIADTLAADALLPSILSVIVRELGVDAAGSCSRTRGAASCAWRPRPRPRGVAPPSDAGLRESEGVGNWVVTSREALIVNDISRDFRFKRAAGVAPHGSLVAVPLVSGDRVLGVLHVHAHRPSAFGPSHVRILRIASEQIASALVAREMHRNLVAFSDRLEREVHARTEELERKTEDLKRKNETITDLYSSLEEAQRELEERNREIVRALTFNDNIVETVNVGIGVVDHESKVVTWNRAMETISGGLLAKETVLGRHLDDLPAEARESFGLGQVLRDALAFGRAATQTGHIVDLPTGTRLHLNLHHLPVSFQRDGRHHVITVIEDVSANVALHAQQVKAERLAAISATMVSVNHEVNNPLAVILGYVQMLLSRLDNKEEAEVLLHRLRADLARIEGETLRIRDITARLAALIEPVVTSYPSSPGIPMVDLGRSR
jgi:PAS domain S-box-containing protein